MRSSYNNNIAILPYCHAYMYRYLGTGIAISISIPVARTGTVTGVNGVLFSSFLVFPAF